MYSDISLPVHCLIRMQQVLCTCCGCHAPWTPSSPSLSFWNRENETALVVCTVYVAMSGSETFYQDFYADIHPAFPQGH